MHAIASSSESRLRRATPPWPCLRGASTRDVSTRSGPRCRSGSQGEGMQADRWHRGSADALTPQRPAGVLPLVPSGALTSLTIGNASCKRAAATTVKHANFRTFRNWASCGHSYYQV